MWRSRVSEVTATTKLRRAIGRYPAVAEGRSSTNRQAYREAMHEARWDHVIAVLESNGGGAAGEDLSSEDVLALAALHGLKGDTDRAIALCSRLTGHSEPSLAVRARWSQGPSCPMRKRAGAFLGVA